LANKLSSWFFEKEEEVVPLFENQLKLCGVEYFDFYLFHSMTKNAYEKHKNCNTFEIVKNLKEQGKIRHIAMSFHDTADVLDMILSEQPLIEAVQLQINYLDYDDPAVQSKACYDVAVKHGKDVIVMEPVKGGALVNLPDKAARLFSGYDASQASFALRYAASYPKVFMTLSGMGNMEMMQDNIKTMKNFVPLNEEELEITAKARAVIREVKQIPCTKCNYCADVCPTQIPISDIFSAYNGYLAAKVTRKQAKDNLPDHGGKATDCIGCGECENVCPQSIKIRDNLEKVAKDLK
jgi:predicted aldo/keto reductase-like oxidoreductase